MTYAHRQHVCASCGAVRFDPCLAAGCVLRYLACTPLELVPQEPTPDKVDGWPTPPAETVPGVRNLCPDIYYPDWIAKDRGMA